MISSCVFAQSSRILALGDSYTIGHGVEVKDRWPEQLKDRLRAKGMDIAAVKTVARTGWTTQDLLSVLEQEHLTNDYDLVFVLIGANDQFRRRPVGDFVRDLGGIYAKAIGYARNQPAKVVAVSIPDWALTPFAAGRDQKEISREIDVYNQAAQTTADKSGIRWVNITDISRRDSGPSGFVPDGLHPAAQTYGAWVDIILPAAEDVLLEGAKKK